MLALVITEKILSIYWDIYLDSKSIIIQLSLLHNLAISKSKARIKLISNCDHTEAPSLTTQHPLIDTRGCSEGRTVRVQRTAFLKDNPRKQHPCHSRHTASLTRTQTHSCFLCIQTVRRQPELKIITVGKHKNY